MEGYNYPRNETIINQKMNFYSYNEKNGILIINDQINNITINGSKNQIYIKSKIPNIIVNGSKNELNMEHRNSSLSNIIFNGNNNSILCNRKNSNFNKIDNGHNNSIALSGSSNNTNSNNFPNYQFRNNSQNTNYSVRIESNGGGFNTNNVYDIINNITGNLNMNIHFNNPMNSNQFHISTNDFSYDSDFISQSNESENSIYEQGEEIEYVDDEAAREEAYREMLIQKRGEKIEELNIFQYKNWNKFADKIIDTCAICLEKYKNSDICKQFSCNLHFFHKNCLDTWLEKSNYCPLCKYDIMDDITIEEEI